MQKKLLSNTVTLLGFIVTIAGIDLLLLDSKLPGWIGLFLIAGGVLIILYSLNILNLSKIKSIFSTTSERIEYSPTISRRIIRYLSLDGKLFPLFIIFGAAIISIVVAYNLFLSPNKEYGSYDLVLILFGAVLIIYPSIPALHERYAKESDFILIFSGILTLEILIAFMVLGSNPTQVESVSGDLYVKYALVVPLVALLNVTGIEAWAMGSSISFVTGNGDTAGVGIAISCSGIYSAMIFFAAFFAFVLSFYYRWERRLAILLVIGAGAAYLANLLRMYIIIIAGYLNGMGNPQNPETFTLLWTHKYIGEIIFMIWIALFWWLTFKYFAPKENIPVMDQSESIIREENVS